MTAAWNGNGPSFADLLKSNISSTPSTTNRGMPILSLPPTDVTSTSSNTTTTTTISHKKRKSRKKNPSPQSSSSDQESFSMEKIQSSLPSPPMSGAASPPLSSSRLSDVPNNDEEYYDNTRSFKPRGRGYRVVGSNKYHQYSAPAVSDFYFYVKSQVEYYFSVENLCRDIYLRRHMDEQGFISVEFLAGFNRLKSVGCSTDHIIDALEGSTIVEVVGDKLRKKNDWSMWVLPQDFTAIVATTTTTTTQ